MAAMQDSGGGAGGRTGWTGGTARGCIEPVRGGSRGPKKCAHFSHLLYEPARPGTGGRAPGPKSVIGVTVRRERDALAGGGLEWTRTKPGTTLASGAGMRNRGKREAGFTLIELLVVVSILA